MTRVKRIIKKWRPYLFAIIMAIVMGFFMSLILIYVNTGISNGFLKRWISAFGAGICISFPISMLIAPLANKILDQAVEK